MRKDSLVSTSFNSKSKVMYLSILKRIDALQEFINYDMINENSFTKGREIFFFFYVLQGSIHFVYFKATTQGPNRYPDMTIDIPNYLNTHGYFKDRYATTKNNKLSLCISS